MKKNLQHRNLFVSFVSYAKHALLDCLRHARYMFLAVLLAMLAVSYTKIVLVGSGVEWDLAIGRWTSNQYFHLLHFSHIALASATAVLTVFAMTKKLWFAVLFGSIVPVFFCTFSDIILPYLGALFVGVEMDLHLCLVCNASAMISFVFLGVLFGALVSFFLKDRYRNLVVQATHFLHGFFGAEAALVYMTGFGFLGWQNNLVYVFILMVFAIVLPCIASDYILPRFVVRYLGIEVKSFCCKGC